MSLNQGSSAGGSGARGGRTGRLPAAGGQGRAQQQQAHQNGTTPTAVHESRSFTRGEPALSKCFPVPGAIAVPGLDLFNEGGKAAGIQCLVRFVLQGRLVGSRRGHGPGGKVDHGHDRAAAGSKPISGTMKRKTHVLSRWLRHRRCPWTGRPVSVQNSPRRSAMQSRTAAGRSRRAIARTVFS